jgi:hypothetical protein
VATRPDVVVEEERGLSVSSSSNHDLDITRRDATLLWSRSSESAVCRLKNSDSSGWHQRIMDGMAVVIIVCWRMKGMSNTSLIL